MADVVTWTVEAAFGTDPLSTTDSDFTADLSDRLRAFPGFSSQRGRGGEFQEVNAGTCTIPLDNTDGELTPANTGGAWYPLLPNRLVRVKATYGGDDFWQFTGLIEAYEQIVEPGSPDQVCLLRVVDGFKVLNLERTPQFPDYPEEVERVLDPVWGYWRLNEPPATRVKPGGWVKKKDNKDRDKKPQRKWRKKKTQRFLASSSGPELQVFGSPGFLQSADEGPVAGEMSYGILFDAGTTQYLRIPVPEADDRPGVENALTVSAVFRPGAADELGTIVSGPLVAAAASGTGDAAWVLFTNSAEQVGFSAWGVGNNGTELFTVASPAATFTRSPREWVHAVGTWRGDTGVAQLFVNGGRVDVEYVSGQIQRGDTAAPAKIGRSLIGGGSQSYGGDIAEVVISEHKFPDEADNSAIQSLYQASIAGFGSPANLPLSGERIEAILDGITEADYAASFYTSANRDIDAGEQAVLPQRLDESKLELLRRVEETENGLLFVDTQGVLQFRDNAWFEAGDGADIFCTLASDGVGIDFQGIAPSTNDDMLWPVVTVTREGGDSQTVGDTSEFFGFAQELNDTLHTTDAAALQLAEKLQARYGQSQSRIYSLTLNALSNDLLYPIVLGAELGYRVVVNHTYAANGIVETFDCRIIGIQRNSSGIEHTATWTLAPSYFPTVAEWYLGVPGFSELQTTTTLA